jgi:ATP-dependent DNA helicase RecQ
VADFLIKHQVSADFYHAGLTATERSLKQEKWMEGNIRAMVCTNAFGMGIDKPDVRSVIHMEAPQSLEAYFQEAGRAGRDGKRAYAVLLINPNDRRQLEEVINSFPHPEQLRRTYDVLCNYLKIPLHHKPENGLPFNIASFSSAEKIPVREALLHIKLLEQMEIISLTDTVAPYPTIKCLVGKEALMNLYSTNPSLEPIIKMILRTSEGVFEDFAILHEKEVASRLNISIETLSAKLKELQRLGIFDYRPVIEVPQIFLLHERVEGSHLHIDRARLELRKQQVTDRARAMLHYTSIHHVCRSKVLVNYFGERFSQRCGICDVCIAENKSGLHQRQFSDLVKKLEQILLQPKTLEQLVEQTRQKPEIIVQVLKRLNEAELIKSDAKSGLYVWK